MTAPGHCPKNIVLNEIRIMTLYLNICHIVNLEFNGCISLCTLTQYFQNTGYNVTHNTYNFVIIVDLVLATPPPPSPAPDILNKHERELGYWDE